MFSPAFYDTIKGAVLAALLVIAGTASAQDSKLEQWGKSNQNFGMDSTTFRQHFASAFKASRAPAPASVTVEELADQITEIRVFLMPDANMAVGEIVISGKTRLNEITLAPDREPVKFTDNGEAPDKKKGDGVFTARFRMDTAAAWKVLRPEIAALAQAFNAPDKRYLRRGPRDIVPARDALEALVKQMPETFNILSNSAGQVSKIAEARNPLEAARVAGIDIAATPFLRIPGPVFEPRSPFRFRHIFDIPVLDFFPPPAPPVPIDETRSLMVVHPDVVDNPNRTFDACTGAGTAGGPWSFGHLMRELSHGTGMSPEDFAMQWLSSWILAQEANGWIVNEPGRGAQLQARVIDSWQRLSGPVLDIDKFPARLLAIVNRPDLADKIGYGVAGSAGEGRFVFGLLEKPAGAAPCNNLPFTVIFEYGIKGGSCFSVKAWHQRWKNLDANPIGSATYNAALELITRDFTDHGSNPGQIPNQSSLNQLRTNENALNPTWQLREFKLQAATGLLDLVTVKQTPDDSFRNGTLGTPTVAAFIVAKEADILGNRHVVPDRFPGILDRFMGAKSEVPFPPNTVFWNAPGLTAPPLTNPAEARRKFSLATCNACHGGETNTFFTHIGSVGTRSPGSPAALSGFLTGIDVTVPVTGGIHHYADLAERKTAMNNILTNSCIGLLGVRKLPFVH